jgi:Tol biopolymer transport system component
MKMIRIALLAGALAVLGGVPGLTQSGQDLFQQALVKEQADGDLAAAIAIYQRIVRDFAGNRVLAAKALVQLGRCHEKLGSREAQKAYEQVLKDYADQKEAAGYARARLTAMRRSSAEPAEPTVGARRLLAGHYGDAVEFSGGPTPDGRSLVYVDSDGMDLAIRDLQAGTSRLITNRASEKGYMAYFEVVSPDGRQVAYAWARRPASLGTELRVVGTDGSGDRMVREEPSVWPRSWSRDGRHIAALVYQGESGDRDPVSAGAVEIAWISVQDGSKTTLATLHYGSRFDPNLSHSPDDRFVAFDFPVEKDSGRRDISLVSTKGSSVVPLVKHPANDLLIGWIPGTNDLLFTSDRSGNRDLWAMSVAADGRAGEPRAVRRGIGEMNAMGFTRDGTLFYYVYTLQYNIFIAPFDEKSGHVALDEAKALGGRGSNMAPSWSPNGQYLSFVRRRGAPRGDEIVYVLDTKTGEERAVAEHIDPATLPAPTWFPDGRSLLLVGKPRGNGEDPTRPPAAYRVDVATGRATRMFDLPPLGPHYFGESWRFGRAIAAGPGADEVVYVREGALVLRHLENGKEVELYRDPNLRGVGLTPDGSGVAFGIAPSASFNDRNRKFMIMPSAGGEARELASTENATMCGWTSDGRYLLFARRDKKNQTIMRVPRKGGQIEPLGQISDSRLRDLSPSPDGRRIAYWTQENEAEIWVLENIKEVLGRAR